MSSVQGASYLGSCWGLIVGVLLLAVFFLLLYIWRTRRNSGLNTCDTQVKVSFWYLFGAYTWVSVTAVHHYLSTPPSAGREWVWALQSCYTRNHLPEFLTLYSFKTRHDIKIWSHPKKLLLHMCWVYLHMDSNRYYKRSLENVFAPFWHSFIIVD